MTRCFILDPIIPGQPSRIDRFQALAGATFGWQFERKQMFSGQTDGPRWIEDIFAALDRADVTACFGEWLAVNQLGIAADRFLKRLAERARNGMPVLLQVPGLRAKAANHPPTVVPGVLDLLKEFEVQPSTIRVGSDLHASQTHISPYCCWFTKGDGCLTNPNLFTGIERVLMSGTNLLDYDGEAFPIIEASPLHIKVCAGDLLTDDVPGRRPACATIRQLGKELQIILGGAMLNDPLPTVGSLMPGIDQNETFTLRLLELMDNHIAHKARHEIAAYGLFSKIERSLGKIIKIVLEPIAPEGKLWRMFPEDIQINLCRTDGGPPDYSRAGFADLCRIVTSNWIYFKKIFTSIGFEEFKGCMAALNRQHRLYLAHPHKAEEEGISFTANDLLILKRAEEIVKGAWQRIS